MLRSSLAPASTIPRIDIPPRHVASLTAISFHRTVVRFKGLVGFRGGEVAAWARVMRMHTYNIHIVPLTEIDRVKHFHCVVYQLYLIDTRITTKVNCLQTAWLLDWAEKLFDHVICESCRLKIHMDKVLVTPDQLWNAFDNLLLRSWEFAGRLGSSAYPWW